MKPDVVARHVDDDDALATTRAIAMAFVATIDVRRPRRHRGRVGRRVDARRAFVDGWRDRRR